MKAWGWLVVALVAAVAAPALAQEFMSAPNPYQGEFAYTIDSELKPAVEVEGVRLRMVRVALKSPDDVRSGQGAAATILYDLENVGEATATAALVVLLEDEQGNGLDRVECEPARVVAGGAKSFRHKVRIQGDALLATRKVYLFFEISR